VVTPLISSYKIRGAKCSSRALIAPKNIDIFRVLEGFSVGSIVPISYYNVLSSVATTVIVAFRSGGL
jgi:hypothetical protein